MHACQRVGVGGTGQTTCGTWFSPSTKWVLGMKLRSSGLAADTRLRSRLVGSSLWKLGGDLVVLPTTVKSEDNLRKSVLSFHHKYGLRDQAWLTGLLADTFTC